MARVTAAQRAALIGASRSQACWLRCERRRKNRVVHVVLGLPDDLQRRRMRKAPHAGVLLISVGVPASIGFGAVQEMTLARMARVAQRLDAASR
jgi:hypothetical protein